MRVQQADSLGGEREEQIQREAKATFKPWGDGCRRRHDKSQGRQIQNELKYVVDVGDSFSTDSAFEVILNRSSDRRFRILETTRRTLGLKSLCLDEQCNHFLPTWRV